MTGDVDQISKLLGRMEADMESSQRQRAELFKLNRETYDAVMGLIPTVRVITEKMDMHADTDERRFKVIESDLGGVKTKLSSMEMSSARKAGAIGLVGAVAAAFGAIGAAAANVFKVFN